MIPHMTYQQYRTAQRLVHSCCNYDHGNCLLLDDGWDTCVCVQSISYSLLCAGFGPLFCRWTKAYALPCSIGRT